MEGKNPSAVLKRVVSLARKAFEIPRVTEPWQYALTVFLAATLRLFQRTGTVTCTPHEQKKGRSGGETVVWRLYGNCRGMHVDEALHLVQQQQPPEVSSLVCLEDLTAHVPKLLSF